MEFSAQNYPTAFTEGHLLTDSLNDWLKKGQALGSFDSETLIFKTICINCMLVQPKPNGLGCIVMDISAPHLNVSRDKEKFWNFHYRCVRTI